MKNILVLTDFSIRAEYAAEYAVHLAVKNKANLILCNIMEITSSFATGIEVNWPIADHLILKNESILDLKELEKKLHQAISTSSEDYIPNISLISDFGFLADVAERIISDKSIDLVVLGSHKSNGLARFLFGSHTHSILDKLHCPVLLIPEGLKFKGLNMIVYATDLTFNCSKVINYLTVMAKPFDASISINHISPLGIPATKYEQSIGLSIKKELELDHSPVFYHTIKGDNVKKSLLELTGSGKVDIVALVHKRYDFFEHLFHSSISKQMADSGKVPLLVMPHSFSIDTSVFTNDQLDHYCYENGDLRL